ncbi:hypothetical protein CRG98_037932 [Punica granatum]|uniref:Uncharacterized protein n=1 Tax=Punica granatum TaxID=22663 RepID=A0A2I0ICG6_PUNGR|nr:hypothetical protein CRG98_037932 [Punica granatum]
MWPTAEGGRQARQSQAGRRAAFVVMGDSWMAAARSSSSWKATVTGRHGNARVSSEGRQCPWFIGKKVAELG